MSDSSDAPPSLRERTRRAITAELIDAAQQLFVQQGYEATTVDQIAAAVGMSKRSFFRYFGSKEELVMGKYEQLGEILVERLEARPLDESLWRSLRHVFDYTVDYASGDESSRRMAELARVVNASDALRAAALKRMDQNQEALTVAARKRGRAAGRPWAEDDPAPRAIVGAAFACLSAANATAAATGKPLGELLDQAMSVLGGERAG